MTAAVVLGEWLARCKAMTGEDIISHYLSPAVDHAASVRQRGEAHAALGRFFLSLHGVLKVSQLIFFKTAFDTTTLHAAPRCVCFVVLSFELSCFFIFCYRRRVWAATSGSWQQKCRRLVALLPLCVCVCVCVLLFQLLLLVAYSLLCCTA
jgi:hypothetical protein